MGSDPRNPDGINVELKVPSLLDVLWILMTKYLGDPQHEDLIFSPQFSPDVRTMICKEATVRGLIVSLCEGKSQSERYIILSRRRSVAELLDYVRANGGETQRYILMEPKGE